MAGTGTGTYECHKVSAAQPEEYQRRQNEALAGLNGVEVIADDILCYGSGETMEDALKDHERNLLNLLDRARSMNLTLQEKVEVEARPSHLYGPFGHI